MITYCSTRSKIGRRGDRLGIKRDHRSELRTPEVEISPKRANILLGRFMTPHSGRMLLPLFDRHFGILHERSAREPVLYENSYYPPPSCDHARPLPPSCCAHRLPDCVLRSTHRIYGQTHFRSPFNPSELDQEQKSTDQLRER